MMSSQTPPPVMRSRLGSLLRRFRKAAGMNGVQAAAVLGWESTRLSRVETGQYLIKASEVARLLAAFGVADPETVHGITDVVQSHQRRWWAAYEEVLPKPYGDSIALEENAVSIKTYFPQLITALLQTPAYAHSAIFSSPSPAVRKNVDSLVQVRQARKMVLTRSEHPALLDTVIDESALFPPAGATPDVMRDQLRGLLDLSKRDNVTIRVMPLGAPAHPGLTSNMTVMDFRSPWPPVVLIDHLRGGVFLEDAEDVEAFAMAFGAVADAALDVDASHEMIKDYMKGKIRD